MASIFYKYFWEINFVIPKRDISFIPYSLVRFTKTCDYFKTSIPTYELIVKIKDEYLNVFRMYDKEISVNIKQKMLYGNSEGHYDQEKIIFEDTFIPFYDKNTIPAYAKTNKTVSADPDKAGSLYKVDDSPSIMNPCEIRFVLLSKKDLAMRKYIHNYVLGSDSNPVNTATAVGFVIDQNDYVTKYLMDAPDNTTPYSDLIIKPADIINSIRQIQVNYGIYSKDLLLFYDSGMLYVLNKYATEHSHQQDEINTISVRIDERSDKVNPTNSAEIFEDNTIGYERVATLVKEDNESILGELVGDKFVYSSADSAFNTVFGNKGKTTFVSPLHEVSRDIQSHSDTGTKKIMDYDMLNNPYNMSSYIASTSVGVPVGFTIAGVNCEHFAPNKRIKLTLDTPESRKLYSGVYNISSATFIYMNAEDPKRRFDTFGHVALTLINKTDGYDKDYEIK